MDFLWMGNAGLKVTALGNWIVWGGGYFVGLATPDCSAQLFHSAGNVYYLSIMRYIIIKIN